MCGKAGLFSCIILYYVMCGTKGAQRTHKCNEQQEPHAQVNTLLNENLMVECNCRIL